MLINRPKIFEGCLQFVRHSRLTDEEERLQVCMPSPPLFPHAFECLSVCVCMSHLATLVSLRTKHFLLIVATFGWSLPPAPNKARGLHKLLQTCMAYRTVALPSSYQHFY